MTLFNNLKFGGRVKNFWSSWYVFTFSLLYVSSRLPSERWCDEQKATMGSLIRVPPKIRFNYEFL